TSTVGRASFRGARHPLTGRHGRPLKNPLSRHEEKVDMSVWVRAYLPTSAGSLDVRVLEEGVRQRLSPLANLVCPEVEMPDDVLDRLRVDAEDSDNWMIFYREEEDRYIPVERFSGDEAVEEIEEAREDLEQYTDQDAEPARSSLSGIAETSGFELHYSD